MSEDPPRLPLDLPAVPRKETRDETVVAPALKPARTQSKRSRQLRLDVRIYVVSSGGTNFTVQAHSPSAAKYRAFKEAQASGLYLYDGGFLAFVAGGIKVAEVRR